MKRILSALIYGFCAVFLFQAAIISAEEGAYIMQYYSAEEKITAYVTGISSDNLDVRISGENCEAINNGDIYNNSEKYETYFLIDSSKSMKGFADKIDSFLRECIDKKPENEYYSIGLFSSQNNPEYIISDENNQYNLEKVIDDIKYDFHSTYIYDNLINVVNQLTDIDNINYKRIVLITDGNENSAKGITIDDVTDELKKSPVPIYTVTFLTSDKSNLENLKNISRLARFTNSADMRVSDDDNITTHADILTSDAKNTFCIEIVPKTELLDGSVKAMEISDGSLSVSYDVRMAMQKIIETVPETQTTAQTTMPESSASVTEHIEQEKTSDGNNNYVIIVIIAAAAAVVCAVIIAFAAVRNKKRKNQTQKQVSEPDNDETQIIIDGRGQTERLIEDSNMKIRTLVLRDATNSVRTFEVQLSQSGTVIGRSSDMSEIVIDYDKTVSRKHCRIYLKDGKAYVEDLGSGNKTYVNNSEVTSPCLIGNADEIKIGRTRLKVTLK